MPSVYQPIEFSLSKFDSLDRSYQTSKARIVRYVGKDLAVLSAFILPVKQKAFVLAHFMRQTSFFKFFKKPLKKKRSKSTRQTHSLKISQTFLCNF